MKKIIVLISGGGSNLEAIAKACQTGNIPASIDLVISNQSNVKGLERAKKFHLMSKVIEHQDFNSREEFDQALLEHILPIEPDLVVLAGFMRILSNDFTDALEGKLINIHPSLLPEYPGLNTDINSEIVSFISSLTGSNNTIKVAFGTEGGLFSSKLSIPTIVCGPGSMNQGHKPDEFVSEEQLINCDRMLETLIHRLQKGI